MDAGVPGDDAAMGRDAASADASSPDGGTGMGGSGCSVASGPASSMLLVLLWAFKRRR